jgi:hypothetical protein
MAGTACSDSAECGPNPIEVFADTLNEYATPLVRLSTVVEVALDTPSKKVVQLVPLVLYWIS